MIGFLSGTVLTKQPPWLLVNVGGVGYELEAPMTTFYDLPDVGEKVELHIHLVVREDAQLLYAFSRLNQRELFRNLLKVNGVGPRVALAILSTMNAEEFQSCIMAEDAVQLTRVPGIGRKTAERLLVEMRDKVDQLLNAPGVSGADAQLASSNAADPASDAITALIALGYKPAEASKHIRSLEGDMSSEQMIREALRNLAKR